jgi:signal transduction histidine kinase
MKINNNGNDNDKINIINRAENQKINIVVADSSRTNLDLISFHLEACGYKVVQFPKNCEALNYLESCAAKVSLIIAELMPEGIAGHEFCRRLRNNPKYKFTPILISSRLSELHDKMQVMEEGADDFINLPIDRDTLITRTKSLIRTQALYDELLDKNTKIEAAYNKLKSAQDTLINNEKFISIGAMAQGLTHEIYNPLTIIGGNLERLGLRMKKNCVDEEFLLQIINSTRNAVNRCTKIVEALETYSAEKINAIQRANVNEILKKVVTLFAVKLKMMHSINIIEKYDESIGEIDCDPQALQQAFMHLMSNAAEAIENNGEIVLATALNIQTIIITVSDNGSGFKEDEISKAFDPFYSTKQQSLSTGLGLAVVSGVVKLHKSEIDIKNNPAGGAVITIKMPADLKLDEDSVKKRLFNYDY